MQLYRIVKEPEYFKIYIRGYSGAYTTANSIGGIFASLHYYRK